MSVGAASHFASLVVEQVLDFGALVGGLHFEVVIHVAARQSMAAANDLLKSEFARILSHDFNRAWRQKSAKMLDLK